MKRIPFLMDIAIISHPAGTSFAVEIASALKRLHALDKEFKPLAIAPVGLKGSLEELTLQHTKFARDLVVVYTQENNSELHEALTPVCLTRFLGDENELEDADGRLALLLDAERGKDLDALAGKICISLGLWSDETLKAKREEALLPIDFRAHCARCGETYSKDSLYACTGCQKIHCYSCIRSAATQIFPAEELSYRCLCGGRAG